MNRIIHALSLITLASSLSACGVSENRTLIIDGILMIREAKSPTLVREMLLAYLPEKHRHAIEDEEEAEPVAA